LVPTLALVATVLSAQAPAAPPAAPALKWRGALWASALTQDRSSADGTLAFRPLEAGQSQFTLDGLLLGVDVPFAQGWSAKATLLGGQAGKVVQATTFESGSVAAVEGLLVWTGEKDTVRLGRMITFIGMEFLDGTQNVTASRGLLFTYADPFGQVGLAWHHAFTPTWSADLWVLNGEDRLKDNNQGKTLGLGLTYNHQGSPDNYVAIHAYRGAEQDGLGAAAHSGAEERQRERLCAMGQWVWGAATLQGEVSLGREAFAPASILGATRPVSATWRGYGLIFKQDLGHGLGLFARVERLADDTGVRLALDTGIRESLGLNSGPGYAGRQGVDLLAQSLSLGVEKKHGPAFARLEARQDRLNRDLRDDRGRGFRTGLSGTLSVGASF
jgi:hypothetical protein